MENKTYPLTAPWLWTIATEYLEFKDFGMLHKYLCHRICEPRRAQIRLILIPRGFFKTSLFTYAHNVALSLENPNIRVLQCSGVLPNAKAMIVKLGKIYTHNEVFRGRFPEWCPKNPEAPETKWNESALYLPNRTTHHAEGTFEAMGADSTIVSRHYDYMKFDDIVTEENSKTPEQLQKVIDTVDESFGLCDHRMKTPVDIIGTTWSDGDVYANYLREWKEAVEARMPEPVDVIKIPATYQITSGNTIGIKLPLEEGESIFPERYPTEDLKKIENERPNVYAKFYELDPVPPGDRTFDNFEYYDELAGSYYDYYISMTVDPSHTENPLSHPSAINITATDKDKDMFCLLSWKDRIKPDKFIEKIWDLYFQYECDILGIESYVYQKVLKYWLQERIVNDPDGRSMRIVELKHKKKQSKEDHIAAFAPFVNTGRYKFKKNQKSLIFQLERFPKARGRDEADAAAYQLHLIKPGTKKNTKRPEDPNSLNAWKRRIKKVRNPVSRGHFIGAING